MKKIMVLMLFAVGAIFAQFSAGVRIGPPPPLRESRMQPRNPGPGYSWIVGYWYPVGGRYRWHNGYWTRPAYQGSRWVEPRHDGERYFDGYWDGDRGHVVHDRHSGRDHDYRHDRNHQ